jgi:hypothetical protein
METVLNLTCDTFADAMVRKCIVVFVKSRVGNGRGGNDTNITAKHPRRTVEGYSQQKKSVMEINDFLGNLPSNHEFGSIGGRFYSLLLLAKGNTRCLVDKMDNASTSDKVMAEIVILVGSSTHKLTSRYGLGSLSVT